MALGDVADRWFSRATNFWAFMSPVVPGTIGGIVIGWAAKGVGFISQFGPRAWVLAAIAGGLLVTTVASLAARASLWRAEAKMRTRVSGESSNFDPMATTYENQRLYLRDLAPLGRKQVHKKRFLNCEIIGPGTIILGLNSDAARPFMIRNSSNFDVDCMEIDPDKPSNLAIGFWDCDFDGCSFYRMTQLWISRGNETLNWMTKSSPVLAPQLPPPQGHNP